MHRSADLLSVVVLNAVALIALAAAWLSVSDATTFADQTSPLGLGVGAVVLSALGNSLYLLSQRRRITDQLDALLTPVEVES